MSRALAVTVVLPIGPPRPHEVARAEEFFADTIESLVQFLPDARYIILDDTGEEFVAKLAPPGATVMPNPGKPGRLGMLYERLSAGFEEALREPFDLLMRLDDDAVVQGNSFVARACALFAEHPQVALLGNHRLLYDGERRDRSFATGRLQAIVTSEARSDPRRAWLVGRLLVQARRHGYVMGESVLGAIGLWNPQALRALRQAGLLGRPELVRSRMAEDQILGLCLRSLGFEMRQFGTADDDLPMGVAWRGLPVSPEEMVAAGKELIHSTKSRLGRDEREIRATFRGAREAAAAAPSVR